MCANELTKQKNGCGQSLNSTHMCFTSEEKSLGNRYQRRITEDEHFFVNTSIKAHKRKFHRKKEQEKLIASTKFQKLFLESLTVKLPSRKVFASNST